MNGESSKKIIIAAVAAGILLLLIGGYFYASSKGVKEFEDYLYDKNLSDAIQYGDVSYSPVSDEVSMNDVDLDLDLLGAGKGRGPRLTGHLDTLSIKDVSEEDALGIYFSGYELVTDPSREERRANILYEMLEEPLEVARHMGLEEVKLEGTVRYVYDRDDRTLEATLALGGDGIARYEMNIELRRARKLARMLSDPSSAFASSFFGLMKTLEELGRVELSSLDIEVRDEGFIENVMYINSISNFSYERALNDERPFGLSGDYIMDEKEVKRAKDVLDEDAREALARFFRQGGDLDVSIKAKRPVSLAKLMKAERLGPGIQIDISN